jgi:hypothetical protein
MKFSTGIAALTMAAGALAAPLSLAKKPSDSVFTPSPIFLCLRDSQAQAIVTAFKWLLANPTSPAFANTAKALFDTNFQDFSDSINFITGQPFGSATFSGVDAFIAGSGSQPPLLVNTLGYFSSCSAINWRWQSYDGVGDNEIPIKGIDSFYITPAGKIKTVYAEFNNAGFIENLGGTVTVPPPPSKE